MKMPMMRPMARTNSFYIHDTTKSGGGMSDSRHGRLIVLCGPAGVGKGTVLGRVREQHPEIWLSVSATTRKPRPGEVDGVNYFFMTEQEFLNKEESGEFLETADVFGLAHYGTPVKPVVEHLERNIPVVLEIDLQGARTVKSRAKELGLDVLTVFIEPPSFEELKRRLIGRGTETPQQQAKRLETAKVELAAAPEFDKRIVNNVVDEAADELWGIIAEEFNL